MATYTVGTGGTYTTKAAFVTDYNAGTIGTAGEDVIAEQISDLTDGDNTVITNTSAGSLVWRSSAGNKFTVNRTGNINAFRFDETTVPVTFEDLVINGAGLSSAATTLGVIDFQGVAGGNVTLNRIQIRDCQVVGSARLLMVGLQTAATMTLEINSCLFANGSATRVDRATVIHCANGTFTVNVNGCVFDRINAPTAGSVATAARRLSGAVTMTLTNSAFTRFTADSATIADGIAESHVTTATFNTEGTIDNIDETEFVNADNYDFRLADGSQLEDAGTDLGNVTAAITYDNFNRHTDPSRDPWDIGAYEKTKAVDPDPPVSWTQWQPSRLRACWTTFDGANLKRSHTTDSYSGGNPTAVTDLKPSIADYATGNLKSGLTIGGDIKPSILKAT